RGRGLKVPVVWNIAISNAKYHNRWHDCLIHQTILFPHSWQNLVPASNFVPHLEHSFLGRSGLPHSGQNFAPCVCAPQLGQSAVASLVRSNPLVRSCSWSFCFIWSTVVCTCAAASSVSMSGAHS